MIMTALALSLALSQQGPEPELTAADVCPHIGGFAETVMRARQNGVPLSEMMAAVPETGIESGDRIEVIAQGIITGAFEITRWHSESSQRREEQNYRAQWELACYQGFGVDRDGRSRRRRP